MGINESLATARDAVKDAALPAEWQVPAFIEVLGHLMTENPVQPVANNSTSGTGGATGGGTGTGGTNPQTGDGPAAKLAAKVKVDEAALLDVFDFSDDGVTLHVANSKIAATKSKATQEIALLIMIARQGSGIDAGWTSAEPVREALQHYNRYDQSNFSANLKGVDEAFNSKGKGAALELRLTQPGWEMATQLVRRVAGVAE